jgi:GT2 family glycosyltransferase
MPAPARVTIGVPVYRGELYLEETLRAIQTQSYREFRVLISMDGTNPVCEKICEEFLKDPRFELTVQPERLGWVGNLNWLLAQVTTDFWYFHQQDDLTEPDYLEILFEHARENPDAALVYCDLVPFGRIEGSFPVPPSVRGTTAYMRVMTLLHEHFPAFAFRGLTRAGALREAGPIPTNDLDDFGVDICWLTGVARAGELIHVPRELYRKRYHSSNTESKWWAWPKDMRLKVWPAHCVNMLEQAMRIPASTQEMRLLWLAAVERLTSAQAAAHFLSLVELTEEDRQTLFDRFLERALVSRRVNIPLLLDADWEKICDWAGGLYWTPGSAPFEIKNFGPNPVHAGEGFNVQPNGSSAIWVQLSHSAEPGVSLRLGDSILETVVTGGVLTAYVPASLIESGGRIPLVVVGRTGNARCEPATFEVLPQEQSKVFLP